MDECKSLPAVRAHSHQGEEHAHEENGQEPGAYTRPRFGSTQAHFFGYVGCMVLPQSIRQRGTGRFDQNGLG
jgi:hypothetical protein